MTYLESPAPLPVRSGTGTTDALRREGVDAFAESPRLWRDPIDRVGAAGAPASPGAPVHTRGPDNLGYDGDGSMAVGNIPIPRVLICNRWPVNVYIGT